MLNPMHVENLQLAITYDNKGRIVLGSDFYNVHLTKRETDVLKLVLQGFSAKRIGFLLKLSPRTVETYIDILKSKFLCKRKNDLIITCIQLGMIKMLL